MAGATTTQALTTPVFDPEVRHAHFFNGRLLSAEDLSREQAANQEERRRLGQAIGEGIARGLEVRPTAGINQTSAPTITVNAGLAINRRGQTLMLARSVDLSLKELPATANGNGTGDIKAFAVCDPFDPDAYVAGAGAYLLTIGEAEGKQGLAPVSGLGNIQASCNAKYLAPGVRFRLIPIDLDPGDLNDELKLRNKLAYRCLLGAPDPTQTVSSAPAPLHADEALVRNIFGPPIAEYGLLDRLRPRLPADPGAASWLQECEVPLALLYLTASKGLVFADMWSVRRRLIAPSADPAFPLLTGDRRHAEGEAMFLQFQAQIQDLLLAGAPLSTVTAASRFAFLPPVGLLPVGASGQPFGFNYSAFFSQMTFRNPIFVEGAQVRPLIQEALQYPPIDTSSGLVVWLYLTRENAQLTLSGKPGQSYLVFASGHTPYRGEPRYDVHHWNFGNFA